MSRWNDKRGGQRPTRSHRGRLPYPGYSTDPERDHERGGNWGRGPGNDNWATTWADEEARHRDDSTSAFATSLPPTSMPRNQPPNPATPWGPTSLTDRIFSNAIESARGRGPPRGIRPMSSAPPRAPSGVDLAEPEAPSYSTSRRMPSHETSSPEPNAHSLMERVRRVGIITDADDRHLSTSAQQVIDDLLFKLKQSDDEKHRLTTKVYDLLKRQKTHRREDDPMDDEDSRPAKRRDPHVFPPPSQSPSSSSLGLSSDFDRLHTNSGREPPAPRKTTETPTNRTNPVHQTTHDITTGSPIVKSEPIRVTPPGILSPDPPRRSDPKERSQRPDAATIHTDFLGL
jgi:hypothetical protein